MEKTEKKKGFASFSYKRWHFWVISIIWAALFSYSTGFRLGVIGFLGHLTGATIILLIIYLLIYLISSIFRKRN